jgi:hypothetical protein
MKIKLITGVSMVVIFVSIYGMLKTVFDAKQIRTLPNTTVAITPTSTPKILPVATTPTPEATPEPTPTSTPETTPTPTLKPLKSRVVKHHPDQFRRGALSKEELAALKKALKAIPWSRNSDPKAAADEDYASIVKECEKSSVNYLLEDLITEAESNDYQPNNEAANSIYSNELTSDFETGVKNKEKPQNSSSMRTIAPPRSSDRALFATTRIALWHQKEAGRSSL